MQLTPIMYGLFAAMTITLTACDKPQTPVENTSLSTPKAEQIVALAGKTMGSTYHIKYLEKNNFPPPSNGKRIIIIVVPETNSLIFTAISLSKTDPPKLEIIPSSPQQIAAIKAQNTYGV